MLRAVVFVSLMVAASAFAPVSFRSSRPELTMLFNFGKKPAAPAPTPVKKVATPVKPAAPVKTAPAPVKKVVPAPVKKAAPAPAPVKKVAPAPAPAPVKKVVPPPAPVKKVVPPPAPVKKVVTAAVKKPVSSSGFAYGIVGSGVEAPDFDPFQLAAGKSEETISWYRAAELKHGRICMLAAVGLFVQPLIHLPDPVFDSKLGYGAAVKLYNERPEAVWQIIAVLGAIEVLTLFKNGQGVAGDLGFDPLDLKTTLKLKDDPVKYAEMQLRELKNGRLAMLGASGLLLQEAVNGLGAYGQV